MRTKRSGDSVVSQEENRRPGWLAIVSVTFTLFVPSSLAQTTPSSQTAPSSPPSYKQLRYDEDWSFLRDPSRRADMLDRIKYIPLGDVETNPGFFDDAPDHTRTFWGVYGVRPLKYPSEGNIDLYYLGVDRKQAHFDQGTDREIRHSIGVRLWGRRQAWDYNNESVYQVGGFGRGKIRAWTVASDTGYTLRSIRFRPRLGLKADIASGDRDRSSLNLQTFNTLFPRGQYFGDAGLISLANLTDIHPSVDLRIAERLAVTGDWAFFWRESVRDGIYGNGINLLRSGQTSRARYIGSQPSLLVEWKANRHITFEASWTYFFAGQFLKETMPGRNLDYITARMTYKF